MALYRMGIEMGIEMGIARDIEMLNTVTPDISATKGRAQNRFSCSSFFLFYIYFSGFYAYLPPTYSTVSIFLPEAGQLLSHTSAVRTRRRRRPRSIQYRACNFQRHPSSKEQPSKSEHVWTI